MLVTYGLLGAALQYDIFAIKKQAKRGRWYRCRLE
jgi:hypothetical protein